MIEIVHARHDENGGIAGKAGDQTGHEVEKSELCGSWEWIIRPINSDLRHGIAEAACQAAENDNIGYSQSDRTSLFKEWKAAGTIRDIARKCNCDCSSLVAVCVNAAGIPVSPTMYTGNEKKLLTDIAFFVSLPYENKKLLVGDILLRSGHTAIVVYDSEGADTTGAPHMSVTASCPADYKDKEKYAGEYVTTLQCYIRDGGSMAHKAIGVLPYWTHVWCFGYYCLDYRGVVWLYVETEYVDGIRYVGFVSENVLQYDKEL